MTDLWIPEDEETGPFRWGVAAFHPTCSSFVAWTRYWSGNGYDAKLVCEISEDPLFEGEPIATDAYAVAARDFTARVNLTGLKPETLYYYRFKEVATDLTRTIAVSRTGRAQTLPAPDAPFSKPFRIGFATCSDVIDHEQFFPAFRKMANENLDLVVFLGDYIYGENSFSQPAYQKLYQNSRSNADLKRLHASVACFAIWDDHEVENDYSGLMPANPDDLKTRRISAYKAFYNYFGLDEDLSGFREIYKSADIGSSIRLFLIDGRKYREGVPCIGCKEPDSEGQLANTQAGDRLIAIEGGCDDLLKPRSLLGKEQEEWLYGAFARSTAKWNIIANNTMFCPLLRRSKDGKLVVNSDAWSGYPMARNELVSMLQAYKVENPIFITGDMHCFLAGNITESVYDPKTATIGAEFVTSAIAYDAGGAPGGLTTADSPHLTSFADLHQGFTIVEIRNDATRVLFMDVTNAADGHGVPGAAFEVKDGKPGFTVKPPPLWNNARKQFIWS